MNDIWHGRFLNHFKHFELKIIADYVILPIISRTAIQNLIFSIFLS